MKDQGMPVMCGWHPTYFGMTYQIRGRVPTAKDQLTGNISHGLCRKCAKKFRQESRGRINA